MNKNKSILILGGAGYVGSNLGHYLQDLKYNVIFLDNLSYSDKYNLKNNDNFIKADIRDKDFSKYLKNVDTVYNFAAISSLPECQSNSGEAHSVNVGGSLNVMESCRREKIRKLIFASTSAVYENNFSTPFYETDSVKPHLLYSLGKYQAEELIKTYQKLYDDTIDISIIRYFNIYGGDGQDIKRKNPALIPYLLQCKKTYTTPILRSSGLQERDYVHIEDVCKLSELVMTSKISKGEIINCCSGKAHSVRSIVKMIKLDEEPIYIGSDTLWNKYEELFTGYSMDKSFIEKETNKYCLGSFDKARRMMGFIPKISMDDWCKSQF